MAGKHIQKNRETIPSEAPARRSSRTKAYAAAATAERRYERSRGASGREPEGRSGARWLIPVLAVLVVIVFAMVGVMVYASRIASIDTIYPNISIDGVDVGGMTVEQAEQALRASGTAPYTNASLTVKLPLEQSFTVEAAQIGLESDVRGAAEAAYAYGRGGTMLESVKTYRACRRHPVELSWNSDAQIDEQALRGIVETAVNDVNALLFDSEAEVAEEGVTLIKGMTATGVDADAVYGQVRRAFLDKDFADLEIAFGESDDTADNGEELLRNVYESIFVEPVNAEYNKETGEISESVRGVSFDMNEARRLWDAAQPGDEVFIPFIFTDPEVDSETLSTRLFADLLAEKTTSLSGSSSNRINNVSLAAQAMNDTIVNPEETFDYNTCLGQRTSARGYKEAGAYSAGQHVAEVGGGICQGSSTLYYCAILADLKITVRSCHYFVVGYLPRGFDATVSWGGPDFRFVNSRDFPIKIKAWVSNGSLTVQIWGTNLDGSYVSVSNDTWEDSTYYYAQTYRTVYAADGTQLSRTKEAYSAYHKYEAGETAPPEETLPPAQTPAPTEAPAATAPPAVITEAPAPTEAPPAPTEAPPVVTEAPPAPTEAPPAPTEPPPVIDPDPVEPGGDEDGGE